MKKIIFTLCLLLSMAVGAHAGMRASQFNIVGWQTLVTLTGEESTLSAQVVDAYSVATSVGEYRIAPAYYRWPTAKPETLNLSRSIYMYNSPSSCELYSFTQALAVI